MDLQSARRKFVNRIVVALILGGVLFVGSAWVRNAEYITRLQEDLLQLVAWLVLVSPLLMLSRVPQVTTKLRASIFVVFGAVVIWRTVDIADAIPQLENMPLLGMNSRMQSGVQQFCFIGTVGAFLGVCFRLFDELITINSQIADRTAQLEYMFDNMPMVCFAFARDGRILSWNKKAEEIYGYSVEEAIGKSGYDLIVGTEQLKWTQRAISKVFAGTSVLDFEWHDRNKAGETGWRIGSAFPFLDGNRKVLNGVAMHVDITERRKAEIALQESEQRFRKAFEEGPMGMGFFDAERRITRANRAVTRMFGYSEQELIGKTTDSLIHPDDLERSSELHQRVFTNPKMTHSMELRFVRKDGTPLWTRVTPAMIFDDKDRPLYSFGMVEDVSEKQIAEDALRQSEELFRQAFEEGPIPMAFAKAGQSFDRVNHAFCEMLCYTEDELRLMTVNDITHPDDIEENGELHRQVSHEHPNQGSVLKRYLKKDGQVVWGQLTLAVIRDAQGQPRFEMVLIEDVTSRRLAEDTVDAERQLLRRLLDIQERERRSVTYDLHDGIVQFVVAAQMQVEACEARLDQGTEATRDRLKVVAKYLEDAVSDGRRMISGLRHPIIDEAGTTAAIELLINEPIADGGTQIAFTHNSSRKRFGPMVESTLFRIAQEAITNLRKHSGAKDASARLTYQNGNVEFELVDDGVGFLRDKVSPERFGLRGIEERARLFGGRAEIESQPGKGTRIYVTLPVPDEWIDVDKSTNASHKEVL